MRRALAILVLAVIALAWFNPDLEDFRAFVEAQSAELVQAEVGDGALGRALGSLGSSLAGSYVDRVTDAENYVVFSVYTLDLSPDDGPEDEWRFIGIGGQFFELHRPERLQQP